MVKNVISNIYTMAKNSITTALNEKPPKKAATAFTLGGLYAAVGGAILGVIISVSIQVNILEWHTSHYSLKGTYIKHYSSRIYLESFLPVISALCSIKS